MFKNFFRGAASMNASTRFEKARIQATYYGDTSAPSETDLQTLIKTPSGSDPEMKAEIGLQTIINKLKVSQSRKYWNYIMKNLVILDRAIEERYFVDELSGLVLAEVEEYKAKQKRYKDRGIEDLVACYFNFIKDKAEIYGKEKFSLNVAKDKRKVYFKVMDPEDILAENRDLVFITTSAFDVFNTGANGHLKYPLNQYVFLLILSSVMNVLSTQYVAFITIVESFFEMDLHLANESLVAFKAFLKSTEDLITFTGAHQFIPGFQISLHELRNPQADTKLLNAMQEYIKILESETATSNDVAVARQSLKQERPNLEPKRSEINIALVAEQFKCERVISDDENDPDESPDLTKMNSNYSGGLDKSGDITKSVRETMSPSKKFHTNEFEKTLMPGFQGLVSLEKNEFKGLLDEYKVAEEAVQPTGEQRHEQKQTEDQEEAHNDSANVEQNVDEVLNTTPAFKKLLDSDDDRSVYDQFQNYFSDSLEEGVWVTGSYPQQKRTKDYFELKPLAIVMTEYNTSQATQDDVFTIVDYKEDVFSGFKNFFSREFRS